MAKIRPVHDFEFANFDDGSPFPILASRSLYEEALKVHRIFYIRASLWNGLIDMNEEYDSNAAWAAYNCIWPFDVATIRFVEPYQETPPPEGRGWPSDTILQEVTLTRQLTQAEGREILVLVGLYSRYRSNAEQSSITMFDGQIVGPGGTSPLVTFDQNNVISRTEQPSILWWRFSRFCDMLTYARSVVTVRRVDERRGKKRRVTMEAMADALPRQAYEIVLRPELTLAEGVDRVVAAGIEQHGRRAQPRRHSVTEHVRIVNGKIVIVSEHLRGGKLDGDGPKPVYNAMPLARWYAQNKASSI